MAHTYSTDSTERRITPFFIAAAVETLEHRGCSFEDRRTARAFAKGHIGESVECLARKALGQFCTGVTVVTVEREPGKIQGMTANSFTSVSLDPLLILVCVDQRAKILPFLQKKKRFGVSVLKAGQQAVSEYFARGVHSADAEERLSIRYVRTPSGMPVLGSFLFLISMPSGLLEPTSCSATRCAKTRPNSTSGIAIT